MDEVVRKSRNTVYVRDGNSIVSIPRNESTSRRSRSAGPSKMNKRGRRSMSEPPAYIQKAKELPETSVVIEKLSQQQIDDLVLKVKLKGIICREIDSFNVRQLNAIIDIIAGKEEEQIQMVTPTVCDAPSELDHLRTELSNLNIGTDDCLNFSIDSALLAESSCGLGDMDWSREFSRLYEMVEQLETTELATNQNDQLNSTSNMSNDWTKKEYKRLFGDETAVLSDDEVDWSMEYVELFEKSPKN